MADKANSTAKNDGVNLTQAALFDADEVNAVLDAGQRARWEAAGRGEYNGRPGTRRPKAQAAADVRKEPPAPQGKPELPGDEELFATHFERRLLEKRREIAGTMEARVDDVRRVVRLAPDRSRSTSSIVTLWRDAPTISAISWCVTWPSISISPMRSIP